jgi:rhodanese-related sulfurtransferase
MSQKQKIISNVVISLLAILTIAGLFYHNTLRDIQSGKAKLWTKEAQVEFAHMTAKQLKESIDAKQEVVVVDLRTRAEYSDSHIPSARNIPVDELDARMLDELPYSAAIVLYCECPTEASSNIGYRILVEVGYKPSVLIGGLDGWKTSGFPTASMSPPTEW